ncbi:MAG: LemA family protein [Clostridiales bacterium]|jgi:LemA protein|nr:LemA family protein [Clostridiales bacterium]
MTFFIAVALAAIAIGITVWAIGASNLFKSLDVKVKEADSGIDVALVKRYDTLVKLMDVVKAHARHEMDVLSHIAKLRTGMGTKEKADLSRQLDVAAERINAVAEAYPELRSSASYKQLQDAILDAEDHLQAARRVYNMNVSAYNQSIVQFPASLIAEATRCQMKEFFEAESHKREDVKINLRQEG